MKFKMASFPLLTLCAGTLVLFCGGAFTAEAQQGSVTWDKPATAKPKQKPRPPSPRRGAPARPREEPLTVEWRVYKQKPDGDGGPAETNPNAVFHDGDLLRFNVTPNYDGYLYVIHDAGGPEGRIIVPDSRVREGQNFLKKGEAYALPAPVCELPNPLNCFYKVEKTPGKEFFTVVFTRNLSLTLPEQVSLGGGLIRRQDIDKLLVNAVDKIRVGNCPAAGANATTSPYALCVTNINVRDNQTIIFRVPVNRT